MATVRDLNDLAWSECELIVAFYAAGVEQSWRSWSVDRLTSALAEQRTELGSELFARVVARYEAARRRRGGWGEVQELFPDRERFNAAVFMQHTYGIRVDARKSDAERWAELCSMDEPSAPDLRVVA
jgi:hypothetical protein